jgi:hypothetical protein
MLKIVGPLAMCPRAHLILSWMGADKKIALFSMLVSVQARGYDYVEK